ncbi:MAG: HD domain-containing protein [Firmicutes bacterium]|nr:HD domain-containing protein [Bacillota bacterium]
MYTFEQSLQTARQIAERVASLSGRVYFVGGHVRDHLLQKENKDIDIEVHGITPAQLEAILDELGERLSIGESFGIYGLRGYSLDIAMPRKETLRGRGHRDFDIFVDPFIGTEGAARRRDFTINALMMDVLSGEIVDHYGGQADLNAGILRHVCDETFPEDPLRVLRGAQFAARFGFIIAPETIELCSRMDLSTLPKERILMELEKALLKAERPSIFFDVLREMNQLDMWFPELKALIGLEQNPRFHAEGDVWTHTMMVLDAAAKLCEEVANPLGFMLAALTHDFGKAITTEIKDGVIHAYDHETKGLPLIETFLKRLTNEAKLIDYVLNLAEYHMKPNVVAGVKSSVKTTNKMFDQSVDPEALIRIGLADALGKLPPEDTETSEAFLRERLAIYHEYMSRPFVAGRDLVEAGLTPGPDFSEILAYAHKLRLAGVEKNNALKQTLAYARKSKR